MSFGMYALDLLVRDTGIVDSFGRTTLMTEDEADTIIELSDLLDKANSIHLFGGLKYMFHDGTDWTRDQVLSLIGGKAHSIYASVWSRHCQLHHGTAHLAPSRY